MFNYKAKSIRNFRRLAVAWNAESELERILATHHGRVINKWKHYFPIYSKHFGHLRDRAPNILEIGVADGGSLEIWRSYFGAKAKITGLDINPKCKKSEEPGTRIYIGDQGDRDLLKRIAVENGPFDLIVEDGSHYFEHQILAFETLFEHLADGGSFVCEDIQTSYLDDDEFGGGARKPGTFAEFAKGLLDTQHEWFTEKDTGQPVSELTRNLFSVHFYPCLVIAERRPMEEPEMWAVGRFF